MPQNIELKHSENFQIFVTIFVIKTRKCTNDIFVTYCLETKYYFVIEKSKSKNLSQKLNNS